MQLQKEMIIDNIYVSIIHKRIPLIDIMMHNLADHFQ